MPADLLEPGLTFRANPAYDVVVLDRLDGPTRAVLGSGGDDAYGALVPRGSSGDVRVLSPDLALLLLTLARPGPLPAYLTRRLGAQTEPTVRRLVLDGVLEVSVAGAFVHGPRAAALVEERGDVDVLDAAALRYGQDVAASLPEAAVAARLYRFARVPISPRLRARAGSDDDVATTLGVLGGGEVAAAAAAGGWVRRTAPAGARRTWWEWGPSRLPAPGARATAPGGMHKLYVSPLVEDVRPAVLAIVPALSRTPGVLGFKIGAGLAGLCRPDKIVVYAADRSIVLALTDRLAGALHGLRAHGVPFTAPTTSDRLLSWGVDPPPAAGAARASSWRGWLVANLAHSLCSAHAAGEDGIEPWRFAVERLRLAGVDTRTWAPASAAWSDGVEAR